MPTYIIQSQWTEQGIRNVKESANRLDLGRKKLKEMGGMTCWPSSRCRTMRPWQRTSCGSVRKATFEPRR